MTKYKAPLFLSVPNFNSFHFFSASIVCVISPSILCFVFFNT